MFLCRAIGGDITTDGDFIMFENNRYSRKGFLFKSFVMSAIVSMPLTDLYVYHKQYLLLNTQTRVCLSGLHYTPGVGFGTHM